MVRALSIASVIAWMAAASVADAQVVTLTELEQHALQTSGAVRAQRARARSALAHVDALRADGLPSLSADVGLAASPGAIVRDCSTSPCRALQSSPLFGGSAEAFIPALRLGTNLRFEGPLYDFGRTDARVRSGVAAAEAEALEVRVQRESVIRTVRTAYLGWVGAHVRRLALERALATANERVGHIEGAFQSGARAAFDADAARMDVARLRLELSRAEATEHDARSQVGIATGRTIGEGATPDPDVLELAPRSASAGASALVRALQRRRDAALALIPLHDLRNAPILTGSATVGIAVQFANNPDNAVLALPNYQLQLGMSFPLWDPRTEHHLEVEAEAQAEAYDAAADEAASANQQRERRARELYERARGHVEMAAEVVRLAERAAASSEERWRIAGGSIESVLSAHDAVQRARDEHVRAQIERTEAALQLVPLD